MKQNNDAIDVTILNQSKLCHDLKPIHELIKEKFCDLTKDAFHSIVTRNEFYYCHNNDVNDRKCDQPSNSTAANNNANLQNDNVLEAHFKCESKQDHPLFLHYICSVNYGNNIYNIAVKFLPTCIGEY